MSKRIVEWKPRAHRHLNAKSSLRAEVSTEFGRPAWLSAYRVLSQLLLLLMLAAFGLPGSAEESPKVSAALTPDRIMAFERVRNNADKKAAEMEILAWPREVREAYGLWRESEINANHLAMFRRNRDEPDEDKASEERLDWPRDVMKEYWKWRNIETDAKYIEVKKRADEMVAKRIEVERRADVVHQKLVNEYRKIVGRFRQLHALGSRSDTYFEIKKDLVEVLTSGKPAEIKSALDADPQLKELILSR